MKPQVIEIIEDIEMADDITLPSTILSVRDRGYAINISAPNELHPDTIKLSYVDENGDEIESMETPAARFIAWIEKYYDDNF